MGDTRLAIADLVKWLVETYGSKVTFLSTCQGVESYSYDDAMVAKQATPEVPPMLVKDENGNLVPLVDLQGRFRPEMGEHAGKYVKNEYYNDGEAPEVAAFFRPTDQLPMNIGIAAAGQAENGA